MIRTKIKSAFILLTVLAALSLTTLETGRAQAAFYNFGTLDIAPVSETVNQNNWFMETIKPGENKQEKIRLSNFSGQTKTLTIYTTDAGNQNGNFFAKNLDQKSEDIADWIKLPVKNINLNPGETKILSVNFELPANAGIGLHTGAIMVRETKKQSAANNQSRQLEIEKGIRVYLTVKGTPVTKSEIIKTTLTEDPDSAEITFIVKNTGTTDIKTNYSLEYSPLGIATAKAGDGTHGNNEAPGSFRLEPNTPGQILIKPGETKNISVAAAKPSFGIYSLQMNDGERTITLKTGLLLPLPATIILSILLILALAFIRPKFDRQFDFASFGKNLVRAPQLKFIGIFLITIITALNLTNLDLLKTQVIRPKTANSYQLTVKWGNLRGLMLPQFYKKNWDGEIKIINAELSINKLLDMEDNDSMQIMENGTVLRFKNQTGPDNDGIELTLIPTSEEEPLLIYKNLQTGDEQTFRVTQFLKTPGIIPNGFFSTWIQTGLSAEKIITPPALNIELVGTPEAMSTPEPKANIPELQNLFIEELPATPEVLSNFILTSDYVDKITADQKTARVETDPILIAALSATPEVLNEIAATPDLNFIFISNDQINFTGQEFSFSQSKVTSENLGQMIFVKHKQSDWNTYIGTTDFQSLSSNAIIPASALTVIPGDATILSLRDGAQITTGNPRTFNGTFDKSVLVEVKPGGADLEIFSINPTLQIKIPPKTPPGRYRGHLTITSL
jgi:hypothetical protein